MPTSTFGLVRMSISHRFLRFRKEVEKVGAKRVRLLFLFNYSSFLYGLSCHLYKIMFYSPFSGGADFPRVRNTNDLLISKV